MHTLFDFITHIKGVEYLISVIAIAVYVMFWEGLKPKPFKTLIESGKSDLEHVRNLDYDEIFRTIKKVISTPFIGLAYVVAIPFGFVYALGSAAVGSVMGKGASFGWRPTEAYLTGKKKKNEKEQKEKRSD